MLASVEQELVARLEAWLPKDVGVLTGDDLAGLTEDRVPTPSVHVIYRGLKVTENRPDGKAARINENWLIVAVVSAARRGNRSDANESANELFDQIAPALMGWKPPSANGPLKLATPPPPAKTNHCLYLPSAFDVETTLTANQ
ncbi:MAG: hypothetical protein CMI09_11725 [Oceanospirillaceae bacterium]|nr:hypothetical protein [Oceanospirillaceae bacterium]